MEKQPEICDEYDIEIELSECETKFIKFCKGHYKKITHTKFKDSEISHALAIFNEYYWDTTFDDNLRGLNRILFSLWFKIDARRNHHLESDLWTLIYDPDEMNKIDGSRNIKICYALMHNICFNSPRGGGYFYTLDNI